MIDPIRPFRWDVAGQARLGSLLDDVAAPDLWFLDELVACAARVLALSADGDLYFVGRSMDSLYDLLSGALRETSWNDRLNILPLSMWGTAVVALSARELGWSSTALTNGRAPRSCG